jgi:hypothetical protein
MARDNKDLRREPPAPKPSRLLRLPSPKVINGKNFWTKGEIRGAIVEAAGEPFEPRPDDEHLVKSATVQRMLDCSAMSIHRARIRGEAA